VPNAAADEIQGIEITRLGTQLRLDVDLDHRVDHREREYFWLKFGREPQPDARDTDADALRRNVISIAPIAQDHTDHALYADMAANFVAK